MRGESRLRARTVGAVALSAAMFAAFGAFGGAGYAASAAKSVVTTVQTAATGKPAKAAGNPAAAPAPAPGNPTRTTICHATGSATNPYVVITVDDNALSAHRAHQGLEDVIPAPAQGCPGKSGDGPGNSQYGNKTTICHRTASSSNPWVMITVSSSALPAHAAHGDLIPAPAQGCPA